MSSSLVDGLSNGRLCTICLNSVVDDNSRGKAELVCGHLFHLDCIGSEFNYRSEMKCPNCRVVENGEWLIPDEDVEDDEEYSLPVVNRRLELRIYSHGGESNSPTPGGQTGGEETRLPMISPVVHYHHNTIVLPPSYGNNNSPSVDSLLRAYGVPQGSNPTQRTNLEQVIPQDRSSSRPDIGEVMTYSRTRFRHNSPSRSTSNVAPVHQRREENAFVQPGMMGHELYTAYGVNSEPYSELRLTTNANGDRSQGEQHGTHEDQTTGS